MVFLNPFFGESPRKTEKLPLQSEFAGEKIVRRQRIVELVVKTILYLWLRMESEGLWFLLTMHAGRPIRFRPRMSVTSLEH